MSTERGACAWRAAPLHPRPLASSYEGEGRWRGTVDAEERRDLKMDERAADLGFAGLFIRLRIDLSRWIGDGRSGEVGL